MKTAILVLAVALCLTVCSHARAEGAVDFSVQPQAIDIGALYDGTEIKATGHIPADASVVIRFLGTSCEMHMKEKGKVFGLMWMNLDSLIFNGVPSVCIVNAAEIPGNSNNGATDDALGKLRLGSLKEGVSIESKSANRDSAFEELVKLKKEEGLYREVSGNVHFEPASDGRKNFRADIPVPSRLLPGNYIVELSVIRNGVIESRAEQPIEVKLVGIPAFLSNLAFGHSALYGILATLIALLGGLAIGVIFQSKGGAH